MMHYDIPPEHHCTAEEIHEQIMEEKYALLETYEDYIECELAFDPVIGWVIEPKQSCPNLQHLRGSLTRWLKGGAKTHFG